MERHYYSGYYQRQFASEEEGWEFVRDLQGKSVIVSYNPRNPAKSLLLDEAVGALLTSRPLAPEGKLRISEVPGWAKPLLWPFIVLSGAGLGLSLWVHLGAVAGRKVAPEAFFWILHMGIFVVWIPAVLVDRKRIGNASRKDYRIWKLALRGAPDWMRFMVYGFLGYAMLNFVIFLFQAPQGSPGANPPAVVWRGFSGHWMLFYSAALATLYAAAATEDQS